MSERRFSKKIKHYYTDLNTGRKYYAPPGLHLVHGTWTVYRKGKIKRPRICFHFKDYASAIEYLREGDSSIIKRRKVPETSSKKISTGHVNVFINARRSKNGYTFLVNYTPYPGARMKYLTGSSIHLNQIEDYSLEMHRPHIEKALKIIEANKSTT